MSTELPRKTMLCPAEGRPFIDRIVPITHPVSPLASYTREVLPDPSANIIFIRYSAQFTPAHSDLLKLSGQLTHKKLIPFSTNYQGFIVKLKPWVLGSLVNRQTVEFVNHSVDLQELLVASDFARLQQQVQVSNKPLEVINTFLANYLKNTVVDLSIIRAIDFIESAHGQIKVNRLAREVNTCTRNFERRFKAQVGLTPKQFIRNQRFTLARYLLAQQESLLEVSYRCGYFDQTHFSKEFKAISGLSPYRFQHDHLSLFY